MHRSGLCVVCLYGVFDKRNIGEDTRSCLFLSLSSDCSVEMPSALTSSWFSTQNFRQPNALWPGAQRNSITEMGAAVLYGCPVSCWSLLGGREQLLFKRVFGCMCGLSWRQEGSCKWLLFFNFNLQNQSSVIIVLSEQHMFYSVLNINTEA